VVAVRADRDPEFASRKNRERLHRRQEPIMHISVLFSILLALLCTVRAFAADTAPSTVFNLQQWKLQLPGPKEIKDLKDYSSEYFHLNAEKEMRFHLDAAEKGTTTNTHYVRSELRHLPNWEVNSTHTISAEVRVISRLKPDKVTVLQIHGITEQGANAPPLLRIAVNNGDLVAVIKTTSDGDKNETVLLKKGLGSSSVKVEVSVKSKQLKITVNDQVMVNRSLSFWKFFNYWKAGCYPQATNGTVDVMFRKLTAN
jgi:Alginate lyase